jgi:DeoR family transcriptional regulator of aga operon
MSLPARAGVTQNGGMEKNHVPSRRRQRILEEVLRKGEALVEDLARQMNMSPMTIRRDLTALEQQGLLRRTHGGAATIEPLIYEPLRAISSFGEQEEQRSAEKRRIGLAAAELIQDGDVVAIGAGTTTTQVARSLRHRKNITIITNAVNIAMELSHRDDLKVIVTGGTLSGDWFALVGPEAIQSVTSFFIDKAFIGVDGVDAQHGLTTNYPDQATIHRAMLRQARQRICVADSRKLGKTGTALIWPADELGCLITDRGAAKKALAAFETAKIRLKLV